MGCTRAGSRQPPCPPSGLAGGAGGAQGARSAALLKDCQQAVVVLFAAPPGYVPCCFAASARDPRHRPPKNRYDEMVPAGGRLYRLPTPGNREEPAQCIGRSPWELTSALELAFLVFPWWTSGATPALMGKSWLVIGPGGVKTSKKLALEKHVNSHGDLPMVALPDRAMPITHKNYARRVLGLAFSLSRKQSGGL